MNIKDVEKHTGMTRASIRFYEAEGLVKPLRSENGYRDYTEKDTDLLQKIKLLRILSVPIEEIKCILQGDADLKDIAQKNAARLEKEHNRIEISKAICGEFAEREISFHDLDAVKYLHTIERVLDKENINQVLQNDQAAQGQIWQRYFARWLDLVLYTILLWVALLKLFHFDVMDWIQTLHSPLLSGIVDCLIPVALMLLIEPILLATVGTTFGKALLRVRVLHKDGRKLTYVESIKRTWLVLLKGNGLCIPLLNLYCNYRSYSTLEKGSALSWEKSTDTKTEILPLTRLGAAVFMLLFLAVILAIILEDSFSF